MMMYKNTTYWEIWFLRTKTAEVDCMTVYWVEKTERNLDKLGGRLVEVASQFCRS